jgi:hypothetical protein
VPPDPTDRRSSLFASNRQSHVYRARCFASESLHELCWHVLAPQQTCDYILPLDLGLATSHGRDQEYLNSGATVGFQSVIVERRL